MSNEQARVNRRTFIKVSGVATGIGASGIVLSATSSQAAQIGVRKGSVILFQGDSITDAGRKREEAGIPNEQSGLGNGYAWLAAAQMLVDRPSYNLQIFNRGVSGNKVFQLAERWEEDCLKLTPDLLSILIGVNDIWHTLDGHYQGTVQIYERDYDKLLTRTREALPKVKLAVCEPFVLRCGAVTDKWFPEFDGYRAAARRIASKHKAAWVPFQSIFNEAIKFAPPQHWAADGVHPTPAGASLMAHAWQKVLGLT